MIFLVELLEVLALLLEVALHIRGARAHKPEAIFSISEIIDSPTVHPEEKVLLEETPHRERGH